METNNVVMLPAGGEKTVSGEQEHDKLTGAELCRRLGEGKEVVAHGHLFRFDVGVGLVSIINPAGGECGQMDLTEGDCEGMLAFLGFGSETAAE